MLIKITQAAKDKAKAEIMASIAKDEKIDALQANSPLKTRDDIKGFLRQYPTTGRLLGHIFIVWRKSTARRPGIEGYWAAYKYPWWTDRTKIPVATLKRHLDRLVEHGLIERQQGHHGGNRVLAFIRPTALALDLSDPRSGDREHLGIKPIHKKGQAKAGTADACLPPKVVALGEQPATYEEFLAILNDDD